MPFFYDLRDELPLRGLLISNIPVDHFAVIVEGLHTCGNVVCLIWKTDGDVYVDSVIRDVLLILSVTFVHRS